MRCTNCGAGAGDTPGGPGVRCPACEAPLTPAPPGGPGLAASRAEHSYRTPYGRLVARLRDGSWSAGSAIAASDGKAEETADVARTALAAWGTLRHPALPGARNFDPERLRCTWLLPGIPGLVPLATLRPPLAPGDVEALLVALAGPLARLHDAGLGAFDLSPSAVFATPGPGGATFVPTPWLASLAGWAPAGLGAMPFAAPELGKATLAYPDPARADVYGLGMLAWYLLTGEKRAGGPMALPGRRAPGLAGWDAFLDGCCRTNPARRFASVTSALGALGDAVGGSRPAPQAASGIVTGPPPRVTGEGTAPRPGPYPNRRLATALLLAAAGGGLYAAGRGRLAPLLPGTWGNAPYRRGFGDTILRYADRDYEGGVWTKVKEADSLGEVAVLDRARGWSAVHLRGVAGWDRENFWILGDDRVAGLVFRCRDGHWSFQARLEHSVYPVARPIDRETLLVASTYDVGEGRISEVSTRGVVELGELRGCKAIIPIAPDLAFLPQGYDRVTKVADGVVTELRPDRDKEASVHRGDNTPLKEYPASGVGLARTPAAGVAMGVAWSLATGPVKVVAFRDGLWYEEADLPRGRQLRGAWLAGGGEEPECLTVVGDQGYVYRHQPGRPGIEISIPVATERTSFDLIRAWGVGPDRFWAMDKSGTVWQRQEDRWRVVVRGLFREDVEFRDAWVAPEGMVIALTETGVYRLE